MTKFSSILIANRGEIACRVIRTAQALGYWTVAVYSTADEDAPHVDMADDAVCIGGPEVGSSYLDIAKIIAAAKDSGADAIHPGYGFLSENTDFAKACDEAGITFIGPSAEAILLMGNKAEAKRRMIAAGVPCIPGYEGEDQSDNVLLAEGEKVGFPLMVKAAAGGGGRGMRLVSDADALPDALASARSEALNAFGSDELILEKAVIRPRHVEVQVFGDSHGTVIHLGERDCSVQRRHQKVIEEAPCPVMTESLRAEMGAAAVKVAQDINYVGAGTVEFLLDETGSFYFLEMNTRLQVEHPVTEEVTGLDLVALQIAVAEGAPLGLLQEDVTLTGHAIEVRLYAEDPANGFLPATGPVDLWHPPMGEGVRVDDGIVEGQMVSPFYDPMIAKLIGYGATRDEARLRLVEALRDTHLTGLPTNRLFLIDALEQPVFATGEATTAFFEDHYEEAGFATPQPDIAHIAIGALIQHELRKQDHSVQRLSQSDELLDWSSVGALPSYCHFTCEGWDGAVVSLTPQTDGSAIVQMGDQSVSVRLEVLLQDFASAVVDGQPLNVSFVCDGKGHIAISGADFSFDFQDETQRAGLAGNAAGDGAVLAPMHGRILSLAVAQGDKVEAGQRLAVLEAMKMEHTIDAPIAGQIAELLCTVDEQKAANDVLMIIAPKES